MDWNEAAENLLNEILARVPRPERDARSDQLRAAAEQLAEEDGMRRVGVRTVISAWINTTPETLRPDLPRQMEGMGLDPEEYSDLIARS